MELVHNIFFYFFDVQTIQIAPLEYLRQLTHNLKKKTLKRAT